MVYNFDMKHITFLIESIVIFTLLPRIDPPAPDTGNAQKFMVRGLVFATRTLIWNLFCSVINNLVVCSYMEERRVARRLQKNPVSRECRKKLTVNLIETRGVESCRSNQYRRL